MVNLDRLRILSARVGSDPLLVQAAGGNTSIKQNGLMWIKASGTWLSDAATRDIFVPLDHSALIGALDRNDPACEACTDFVRGDLNTNKLRPSIETSLHGLMPQKVVVHVHCVNTIAWAIRKDGEQRLREKLAGFNWVFVPYARPGLPLAEAISKRLVPGSDVLVLGNHGLVVAAETVEEAEALLDRVVAALHIEPKPLGRPNSGLLKKACENTPYREAVAIETHALGLDSAALHRCRDVVFYPDHVVFLGVGISTSVAELAPLVVVEGAGVLIHKEAKPAIEPMGRCLADVMRRTDPNALLNILTDQEIGQLINWDAEKYRQSLNVKA